MSPEQRPVPYDYLAVLSAAVVCYAALGAVLSILPRYVPDQLHAGPTALGLAVGAPALTGLLARPFGGRLADRLGPLPPLLVGAGVMAAGAVPAAVSATLGALLVSRLAVGAGEGLLMSATVLWLLRLAGPKRRGRALGHIGLANYAGLALGPLIAAALGGAGSSPTGLWAAALVPVLGAVGAVAARRIAAGEDALATDPIESPAREPRRGSSTLELLRLTAPAGVGLFCVNVGYVSVLSFGAAVARANGTGLRTLIVPVFAVAVIVSRTMGGGIPDRLGGRRTVVLFSALEALGLVLFARAGGWPLALGALLALSVGQSLAVPGLGLLALARVAPDRQGAAAGLFFAWFDAGVGAGGPAVGAVASFAGAAGALEAAAVAVAAAVLIASVVGRTPASARAPALGYER